MSSRNDIEAPSGEVTDNSYVSRSGNKNEAIPVQSDSDRVVDPIDADTADSDAQLGVCNNLSLPSRTLLTGYRAR
jgi:hypothetical protein